MQAVDKHMPQVEPGVGGINKKVMNEPKTQGKIPLEVT